MKQTIFFTSVVIKYTEKNLDIMEPCYSKHVLPFPCPSFHQSTTVAKYKLHANEGHPKTNFGTICIQL